MHKELVTILAFLLFLAGIFGGCTRANRQDVASEVQIELTAVPDPPVMGEGKLIIQLSGEDERPINDAQLNIKGNMTHAGMVPLLAEVSGGENGLYEAPFAWTMAGDWVVTVEVHLPDGTVTRQRFDFAVGEK